jgi:uncharacterized protein YycO
MELLTVQEGINAWLEQNRTQLNEGEVGNAEVLLAAKDMVDSVQDAIEKVGKMQNEQLPQLLDSVSVTKLVVNKQKHLKTQWAQH